MANVSHLQRLIQKDTKPIHYITCKDGIGRDCYFFIMSSSQKIEQLQRAIRDSDVDLSEFGHIVASGFGTQPSEAVSEMLKRHYHVDPDLLIRHDG